MATRHRFVLNGETHSVVVDESGDRISVTIDDGDPVAVDVTSSGVPGQFSIIAGGAPRRAYVARRGQDFEVTVDGRRFDIAPASAGARGRAAGPAGDPVGKVTSPLAGVVVDLRVAVGDAFEAGDTLAVVEAMKMQNELSAAHSGSVTAVHCEQGGRVEAAQLFIEYDADPDDADPADA